MRIKVISIILSVLLFTTSHLTVISAESTPSPHADTGGPYTGVVGLPVQFDGSDSYIQNGNIVSYEWYCGDGTVENGMNPTHIYSHPGVYTLTLTIKDEENNCGTDTTEVNISEDSPPSISFEQPNENSIYFRDILIGSTNSSTILIGPNTIIVNANDDIDIEEITIYVDNKLEHTDNKVPCNWTWKKGHFSHTIKATVTDTSGQKTSIEKTVFKWRLHPLLLLSVASTVFNNQNNNLFSWNNINSKDQTTLLNLLKTILQPSDQKSSCLFSLLAYLLSNEKNTYSIFDFLRNNPLIQSVIENNYPFIYYLINRFSNDNQNSNPLFNSDKHILRSIFFTLLLQRLTSKNTRLFSNRNQIFDGGFFITWLNDHPFFTIISAIILLTILIRIRNKNLGTVDDAIDDAVENKEPVARSGGPYTGVIDDEVSLSASNSYDDDGSIVSYTWDFGDGTTGSGETVTHSYDEIGTYTIVLTVTDNDGITTNDTTTITISEHIEESTQNQKEQVNTEFWIISGALCIVLASGVAVLHFRRRLFE